MGTEIKNDRNSLLRTWVSNENDCRDVVCLFFRDAIKNKVRINSYYETVCSNTNIMNYEAFILISSKLNETGIIDFAIT